MDFLVFICEGIFLQKAEAYQAARSAAEYLHAHQVPYGYTSVSLFGLFMQGLNHALSAKVEKTLLSEKSEEIGVAAEVGASPEGHGTPSDGINDPNSPACPAVVAAVEWYRTSKRG
ncbi:unnamed protein product, partial [Amoebophrya sp. A25]|eukprot:GSA25T00020485001.1